MKFISNKKSLLSISLCLLALLAITIPHYILAVHSQENQIQPISTEPLETIIKATGSVQSSNQAILHFNAPGKVVELPFQEGDHVQTGQIIASLDTVNLNIALQQAINNQKAAHAALEKTLDDIHLFQYGNGGFSNVGSSNETETQKQARIQAQEAAANADEAVKAAQQAYQDAVITAPLSGILVQEDIDTPNVNVTPTTTFIIADTNSLVFQAQIADTDINHVSEGEPVNIQLDYLKSKPLSGVISKIYPEKITLPSGASGFKVDIASSDLAQYAHYGDTGTILVTVQNVGEATVPAWTVLDHQYIWVLESNKPKLIPVSVGETQNGMTEILKGVSAGEDVITDPTLIIKGRYQIQ